MVEEAEESPEEMVTLVVARYNESLDWIFDVLTDANNIVEHVYIYNKGRPVNIDNENITVKNVPNVGREGDTYLRFIIDFFHKIPTEGVVFLQGDPFEHAPDTLKLLRRPQFNVYKGRQYQAFSCQYTPSFPPRLHQSEVKQPHTHVPGCLTTNVPWDTNHYQWDIGMSNNLGSMAAAKSIRKIKGENVRHNEKTVDYICRKIGIRPPTTSWIRVSFSGCFYARRSAIRRHPRKVWAKLRQWCFANVDHQMGPKGFNLEFIWCYLMTGFSAPTGHTQVCNSSPLVPFKRRSFVSA